MTRLPPIIFALLFFCLTGFAQETTPTICDLTCYSGATLSGIVDMKSFKFLTKEGEVSILIEDVVKIKVGLHPPKDYKDKIDKYIGSLGSNDYKVREVATKELLSLYRFSYLPIQELKSSDKEVLARKQTLLEKIKLEKNLSFLPDRPNDMVDLVNGSVYIGKIQLQEIKIATEEFGMVSSHLSNIKQLTFNNYTRKLIFDLNASISYNLWHDTGIDVSGPLKIQASGTIDVYPDEPGKYTATAAGSEHPGALIENQTSPGAGTLLGKVVSSTNSEIFIVGANYNNFNIMKGRLFLKINPSTWNKTFKGSYQIHINP